MLYLIARGETDTSFLVRKIIDPDYLEKEVACFQLEEISDSPFRAGFRLEYSSLVSSEKGDKLGVPLLLDTFPVIYHFRANND